MKNFFRTSFIVLAFCFVYIYVPQSVFAAQISLVPSSREVSVGQEFYVDVYLDTQGESVNTAGLTITFPETVSYAYSNEGQSIIPLWVENPTEKTAGELSFSGIIPGGFNGYIDPFDTTSRAPGSLIRLYFIPKTTGPISISAKNPEVYRNDGSGTRVAVTYSALSLNATSSTSTVITRPTDTEAPLPFTPVIVTDELLFDGAYVVVFTTKDLGGGIVYYEVRENNGEWVRTTSPYVLKNQKKLSSVSVRAFDRAGNQRLAEAEIPEALQKSSIPVFPLLLGVALLILCAILIYRWKSIQKLMRKK